LEFNVPFQHKLFYYVMPCWCGICCGLESICPSVCYKSEFYHNG